jgi:hypothetical protein
MHICGYRVAVTREGAGMMSDQWDDIVTVAVSGIGTVFCLGTASGDWAAAFAAGAVLAACVDWIQANIRWWDR